MIRLCVICEGHTEANFVKECLEPHLRAFDVGAYPSLLKTRPGKQGGGAVTVARVGKHLQHEYHHADRITTLLDLYGFGDSSGQGKAALEAAILTEAARLIKSFNPSRVLPYIQPYEFESLLFSDIEQFGAVVIDAWNDKTKARLAAIRSAFQTPEDINNSIHTAPSKRLAEIFPGVYSKTEHGPVIASFIGLQKIRTECPQFHAWLHQLERLAASPAPSAYES